jgi:hypothetical protein
MAADLAERAWWCVDCKRLLTMIEEPRLRRGAWRAPQHPRSHVVVHVFREPWHLGIEDGVPIGCYIVSVARGDGTDQPRWVFGPLEDSN